MTRRGDRGTEAPLQIVVRADGRVAFGALTEEMLEVALALAPQDGRLRARAARRRKRGADEAGADRGD